MSTVIVGLSVSLDGYIAGAGDGVDAPLGRGGEALFAWMTAGADNPAEPRLAPTGASKSIVDEWQRTTGAMISGRRTFDIARGWSGGHPIDAPIFVLTHRPPTEGGAVAGWSDRVSFVTEGIERALDLAGEAAGDRVVALGSADVTRQALRVGRLDEIEVSVVPVLLGSGVRLFDEIGPVTLEQTRVVVGDGVTHLRYRVCR
ncbi:dihydrofolate reductase family protein [Cryptosporangium minutisporangium]|uniref:Dihydrofolate reductase family protein n=1 Tax=Cryptosporangium minutisporangium TaxID=113569 RepID=A0ABP6T1P7_9ACTN